jgi:4-amino-4-deoxy-L-arabinose transferase-like glycosyltransferase
LTRLNCWRLNHNGILWRLAVLIAILFAVLYFFTAIPRLLYPYDLDFIEDGVLMTALRLAENRPIFIPPQAEFTPHVYLPLYPWLGSLLFKAFGPGFFWLRLLSLAAAMMSGGLIFGIARRESGQTWLAVICAGLFLGGYRLNGFWYELARVDSLFVGLSLAGLSLGVYGRHTRRGLIAAAVGLALAFWSKQTGLLLGLGFGLYLLTRQGRRTWPYWLTFGLLTAIPVIVLNNRTNGWFLYYTFHIARINPLQAGRVLHYIGYEVLGSMAGLSVMAIGTGLLRWRRVGLKGLWSQPWLVCIGLGVVISGLGRASVGGNINNRMLAYTLLCAVPALLSREWDRHPAFLPRWQNVIGPLLVISQFALGVYNPLRYIPTPAMRPGGDRLIADLTAIDGEVLVLMHPYYAWLAGKRPSAQIAAMWHARERGTLPLPTDFVARIEAHYYAVIISDESLFETEPALRQLLHTHYTPLKALAPTEAPPTTTGMVVRPQVVYVPQP